LLWCLCLLAPQCQRSTSCLAAQRSHIHLPGRFSSVSAGERVVCGNWITGVYCVAHVGYEQALSAYCCGGTLSRSQRSVTEQKMLAGAGQAHSVFSSSDTSGENVHGLFTCQCPEARGRAVSRPAGQRGWKRHDVPRGACAGVRNNSSVAHGSGMGWCASAAGFQEVSICRYQALVTARVCGRRWPTCPVAICLCLPHMRARTRSDADRRLSLPPSLALRPASFAYRRWALTSKQDALSVVHSTGNMSVLDEKEKLFWSDQGSLWAAAGRDFPSLCGSLQGTVGWCAHGRCA